MERKYLIFAKSIFLKVLSAKSVISKALLCFSGIRITNAKPRCTRMENGTSLPCLTFYPQEKTNYYDCGTLKSALQLNEYHVKYEQYYIVTHIAIQPLIL